MEITAGREEGIHYAAATVKIACSSTPEDLESLREALVDIALERGADRGHLNRIVVVVDAILENIRVHAYPEEPGPVSVEVLPRVGAGDRLLHLRIIDRGPFLAPLAEEPGANVPGEGGLPPGGGAGLDMIHTVVCGMSYARLPDPEGGANCFALSFLLC